jgi:serine/threonine protein kinase
LLEELGKGGTARVYLASEKALGDRPVVLKIDQNGAGEAHVLGRLQHPNIVPVYSVHTDPGSGLTGVCMPYLSSATLFHALRVVAGSKTPPRNGQVFVDVPRDRTRTALSADGVRAADPILRRHTYAEAVAHLGAQLADALAYAHTRGIFHRDLKPSNVLLGLDGRPMLMDFNLAADRKSAQDVKGGTIPYMAPEQHQALYLRHQANAANSSEDHLAVELGESDSHSTFRPAAPLPSRNELAGETAPMVDARSDIFSLGVILYQLLSGSLPFPSVEAKEWKRQMGDGELLTGLRQPKPLQERCPQVDKHLAGIVYRCLAFDPNDRPQTAAELSGLLRRYLKLPHRAGRFVRRHGRRLIAASALIAALSITSVAYVSSRPPPPQFTSLDRGWEALRQRDYRAALQWFSKASEEDPDSADAFYGRGRAFVHTENWQSALESFATAWSKKRDLRFRACSAHCLAMLGGALRYQEAIRLLEEVVREGGETPIILNNLGCLCRRIRRQEDAERWLERAVMTDPGLQAAWHNRIDLHVEKAVRSPKSFRINWMDDIPKAQSARKNGDENAFLLLDMARLAGLAAQTDSAFAKSSLDLLERSISLGLPSEELQKIPTEPAFKSLAGSVDLQELLSRAPAARQVPQPRLVLDPIEE